MGPLDVINHLANLFLPALALGALSAAVAKLLWRRALATVAWRRLAGPACGASAVAVVGGFVLTGRDGRIGTYAAMVVVCALALWWRGFGPGRR